VIYRSGIGRWERPVSATSLGVAERDFAEREWSTLVNVLLLEFEQRCQHPLWINRPSASLIVSQKHNLLTTADIDGFRVPLYSTSTQGSLPTSVTGRSVSKAINEDEDVDDHHTFATSEVPSEVIAQAPFRSDCPTLIQKRVYCDHELRAYTCWGSCWHCACSRGSLMSSTSDFRREIRSLSKALRFPQNWRQPFRDTAGVIGLHTVLLAS
jgi:hypothetical protein